VDIRNFLQFQSALQENTISKNFPKTVFKKKYISGNLHFDTVTPMRIAILIVATNKYIRYVAPLIESAQKYLLPDTEKKYFVSSIGSKIDQEIVWSGAGIESSAVEGAEFQNRSYPNSFRGQNQTRGFELVRELKLEEHGERIAKEAVDLLSADICPTGEFDLILDSNQLALQIHESCGHAVELDRVLGYEASYAGTSFFSRTGRFQLLRSLPRC